MGLPIIVSIFGLIFFISVVNFYFQKQKYRYSPKEEIRRLPLSKSPTTWLVCAIISVIVIGGAFVISIKNITAGFSGLGKQQNSINEYQNQLNNQSTDSTDSTSQNTDGTDQSTNSSQTNN